MTGITSDIPFVHASQEQENESNTLRKDAGNEMAIYTAVKRQANRSAKGGQQRGSASQLTTDETNKKKQKKSASLEFQEPKVDTNILLRLSIS